MLAGHLAVVPCVLHQQLHVLLLLVLLLVPRVLLVLLLLVVVVAARPCPQSWQTGAAGQPLLLGPAGCLRASWPTAAARPHQLMQMLVLVLLHALLLRAHVLMVLMVVLMVRMVVQMMLSGLTSWWVWQQLAAAEVAALLAA